MAREPLFNPENRNLASSPGNDFSLYGAQPTPSDAAAVDPTDDPAETHPLATPAETVSRTAEMADLAPSSRSFVEVVPDESVTTAGGGTVFSLTAPPAATVREPAAHEVALDPPTDSAHVAYDLLRNPDLARQTDDAPLAESGASAPATDPAPAEASASTAGGMGQVLNPEIAALAPLLGGAVSLPDGLLPARDLLVQVSNDVTDTAAAAIDPVEDLVTELGSGAASLDLAMSPATSIISAEALGSVIEQAASAPIDVVEQAPLTAIEDDLSDLVGADPGAGVEVLSSLLTISDVVELPTPANAATEVVQSSSASLIDALADDVDSGLVPDEEGAVADDAPVADPVAEALPLVTHGLDHLPSDDLHLGLG